MNTSLSYFVPRDVKTRFASIAIGAVLGIAGCGGGSDDSGQGACSGLTDADVESWEGIYQLTSYTKNASSCDAEGASVLASQQETLFLLRRASAFGRMSLWLLSCIDVANCQDKRAKFDQSQATHGIGPPAAILFQFTCPGPNGSLTATITNTGFSRTDGTCHAPSISEDALSHQASGSVRVESRKQIGDDYSAVNGYCTTDAAHAASTSKPCTELEALAGQFLQP
jgi:hypothetical protein